MFGALSAVAVPAAIAASQLSDQIEVLNALIVGVPVALVLALASFVLRRRARRAALRSVNPGAGRQRVARWLGWTGLYLGLMGGLSLAFYGILRLFE